MEVKSLCIKKTGVEATWYRSFVFSDRDNFLDIIQEIYLCITLFYCDGGVLHKRDRRAVLNA